jgi:branched-chain amino acid transport system substrate-binding protein
VFNNLIGISAYQFLRDFRSACLARGIDQPREIPTASCSLSEPELEMIGPDAVDGHFSSSVYFSTIRSEENARFVAAYQARFPEGPSVCADAEAAYVAVRLLAMAMEAAGEAGVAAVKRAAVEQRIVAPQGEVWLDRETLHAALTPRIGRSTADARFEILMEASRPMRPDPYLIWNSPRFGAAENRPALRVAS